MANTIGFGQAAVNNTIDYGQGAIDNTINWGKSQTLSPSGETNITGTGGTPPFSNVNSFSFDGVDDYFLVPDTSGLSFGNGTTDSPFSISTWIKIGQTTAQGIVTKYGSTSATREWLFYTTGGKLRLLLSSTNGGYNFATGTTNLSINTWYHVACTYDGRGGSTAYNGMSLYINGIAESVTTANSVYVAMSNTNQNVEIGKNLTNEILGNIDETAIFNSELSASDVSAIYNNGDPQSLDTYSPFVWFRMGDNATWNGATWTMTSVGTDTRIARSINMVEANRTTDVPTIPFSTKSILLDGVDDYVDCGNGASLQITGAFTISAWVKTTDTNYIGIYGKGNSVALSDVYFRMQNTGVIRVFINNTSVNVTGTTAINDGNWHHVMFVYVPSTSMTIYVDGSQDAQNTTSIPSAINNNYSNVYIGQFQKWLGNIDEVAVWNNDQSANASAIGSTIPTDLSTYSPLSWWRCGDGDTAPTLTDNGSGGNDGTMTNFTTFSTDVPT